MAYLKLIANPVRRRGVPPRRGRPEARARRNDDRAARRGVASTRRLPMFEGARDPSSRHDTAPAARVALARVRATHRLVARARGRSRGRRAAARARRGDSLRRLSARRRARVGRAPRQRARADRPAPPRRWPTSWAKSDFARSIIFSSARARRRRGRSGRRRRRRHAHDAAQRQGPRVPVVFITGLEDGLFPLAKAYDDPPLLEEERRLFYVGITRAERKLYISLRRGAPAQRRAACRRVSRAFSTRFPTRWSRSGARSKCGAPGARSCAPAEATTAATGAASAMAGEARSLVAGRG